MRGAWLYKIITRLPKVIYLYKLLKPYLRVEFIVQRCNRHRTAAFEILLWLGVGDTLERRSTRGDFRVPPSRLSHQVTGVVTVLQQHRAHPAVVVGPAMTTKAILASLLSHLNETPRFVMQFHSISSRGQKGPIRLLNIFRVVSLSSLYIPLHLTCVHINSSDLYFISSLIVTIAPRRSQLNFTSGSFSPNS